MSVSIFTHHLRVLASGTVVAVEADGHVTKPPVDLLGTCTWLVQCPSGNPEPDSEADCWITAECGAPALFVEGEGWECLHGHRHLDYGSPAQQAEEAVEAMRERSQEMFG